MDVMRYLELFFAPLLQLMLALITPAALILLVLIAFVFFHLNREYKKGTYYQITKISYLSVRNDTGRYGEYLTYRSLKQYEETGAKFLFNVYIPKEDKGTTEIDVLMITSKGIFVFESKNYSGWIFGSEHQKSWYQTLPLGRNKSHKETFFNPIMQNRAHIKHLRAFLGEQMSMHSIVVFSERCTLKNVQVKSDDIRVIRRCDIAQVVLEIFSQYSGEVYSESDIMNIYNRLYPLTQVDESVKAKHVDLIRDNLNGRIEQQKQAECENVGEAALQTDIEISQQVVSAETDMSESEAVVDVASTDEAPLPDTKPIQAQLLKCPKCGGDLVLKTATRGANVGNQFYGCSAYPKCRYIQNIKDKAIG